MKRVLFLLVYFNTLLTFFFANASRTHRRPIATRAVLPKFLCRGNENFSMPRWCICGSLLRVVREIPIETNLTFIKDRQKNGLFHALILNLNGLFAEEFDICLQDGMRIDQDLAEKSLHARNLDGDSVYDLIKKVKREALRERLARSLIKHTSLTEDEAIAEGLLEEPSVVQGLPSHWY